jgi:hypothetical protein
MMSVIGIVSPSWNQLLTKRTPEFVGLSSQV